MLKRASHAAVCIMHCTLRGQAMQIHMPVDRSERPQGANCSLFFSFKMKNGADCSSSLFYSLVTFVSSYRPRLYGRLQTYHTFFESGL